MTRKIHPLTAVLVTTLLVGFSAGCSTYKTTANDSMPTLEDDAQEAIVRIKEAEPSTKKFFDDAYAYAVFPEVSKGAAGLGGAHGRGVVYRDDDVVGYATLSQGSLGAQLGGQVYREIIFLKDRYAFSNFKDGDVEFSAQASAVAANADASANADYSSGVAIFTLAKGGLMYEASIGGQKFSFRPLHANTEDSDTTAYRGSDAISRTK